MHRINYRDYFIVVTCHLNCLAPADLNRWRVAVKIENLEADKSVALRVTGIYSSEYEASIVGLVKAQAEIRKHRKDRKGPLSILD